MTNERPHPLEAWTQAFNTEQLDAFEFDGHCAVLAGPGSGKTKVLVARVSRVLNQRAKGPRGLACVTYNNETVRELRKRLLQLGNAQDHRLFIGTVHSFCLSCIVAPFGRLLRDDLPEQFAVADSVKQLRTFELAVSQSKIGGTADIWKQQFQQYRRTHPIRNGKSWKDDPRLALLIETYEALMRKQGLLDFDDMAIIALDLINNQPFVREAIEARFPFLVIDEYQDLGYPLHAMVQLLMRHTKIEIFAVGDPDQSIYGFTGADPKYLRELADLPSVHRVELKMNYRCAQRIIDSSQIALALDEPHSFISSRDEPVGDIFVFECPDGLAQQAETIANQIIPGLNKSGTPNNQIAILYIDKWDQGVLAKSLEKAGIKFAGEKDLRYVRNPFTRWLEDIAKWCCSYPEIQDSVGIEILWSTWAEMKIEGGVSVDTKGLSEFTGFFTCLVTASQPHMPLNEWLKALDLFLGIENCLITRACSPEEVEVWGDLMKQSENGSMQGFTLDDFAKCGGNPDTVTLTTLHSSKGSEYKFVIMPGLEQGRLPNYAATSREALSEARRVFYVGITRAKDAVYLLYSMWYANRWGTPFKNGPSQFVGELLNKLGIQPVIIDNNPRK